ncbi:MAG: hypothetical protein EOP47_30045 [Sphingobacteriaceae bacterium]|nr:MAG: hypothetical protein EOP47_30045 [Sphingobacteriaceae bacterium]
MKIFQALLSGIILTISMVATVYSQTSKSKKYNTSTVVIVPELSDDLIFDTLNNQVDFQQGIIEPDGTIDTLGAKTTSVIYKSTRFGKASIQPVNCKAWMKSDTLFINVGSWDGYTGGGFTINYINRNFVLEPYYSQHTDAGPDPHPPVFTIIYCDLKLDKPVYTAGNMVHGYVDFKIKERHYGKTIMHTARGYFRDRIKIWWGNK